MYKTWNKQHNVYKNVFVGGLNLDESWCALFIAIYYGLTPDQAFKTFWTGKISKVNKSLTKEDELEMIRLKQQGITYKEIGAIYGISDNAVYKRIKYRRKGA